MKRLLQSSLLLLLALPAHAQFTDVINSNRPGKSMGAFSVGKTVIQGELGVYGYKEEYADEQYDAEGIGSDVQIRYGAFFEQLEIIGEVNYQNEVYKDYFRLRSYRDAGLRQISIGAKYLVYDPMRNYEQKPNLYSWKANHKFSWRAFIPAVGVYGGLNFNTARDKFLRPAYPLESSFSPTLGVLTQNQFGRLVLCINVMADQLASNRESIDYIVTLTNGINSRWSAFLEHQGYINDYHPDNIFRLGAAWLAMQNLQIDASIAASIRSTPSYLMAGVGVSWRFDGNYEEVFLRKPQDEKKESKADKKKKKDKEKAKKRLDAIENGEPVKE